MRFACGLQGAPQDSSERVFWPDWGLKLLMGCGLDVEIWTTENGVLEDAWGNRWTRYRNFIVAELPTLIFSNSRVIFLGALQAEAKRLCETT